MIPFLVGAILRIDKLKQHIELLDREQHAQNKDILELLKYRGESSVVILQHSDVITYLCDQDPLLNKICLKLLDDLKPVLINEPSCINKDPSPSKQITLFLLFNDTPKETIEACPIPPAR
jgi:hypothetical protein